jgi:uncharacterized protein (TIGR03437 family)
VIGADGLLTTFAGNGNFFGDLGDGGPAREATLFWPGPIAFDPGGNLYVADYGHYRIRRITPDGIINTVVGNGTLGSSGNGGPATKASIWVVYGMAFDGGGNLYFTEPLQVRRVTRDGMISTFAGNGGGMTGEENVPATKTGVLPTGIGVDDAGNVYFTENIRHTLRRVDPSGTVTTVVGTGQAGFSGDGGPARLAELCSPEDLLVTSSGLVYLADTGNDRIRVLSPSSLLPPVGKPPAFTAAGVIDVWSFQQGLSPGGWSSIYGENLAAAAESWSINGDTLPTLLGGTSVRIAGKDAVLSYVSPTMLNVLVPGDVPLGEVPVTISTAGRSSATLSIRSLKRLPAVFAVAASATGPFYTVAFGYGTGQANLVGTPGTRPDIVRQARRGELVDLFCIGLGPTSPPFPSGISFAGFYPLDHLPSVQLGDLTVTAELAALVSPGLYVVRLRIPDAVPSGLLPLSLDLGDARTRDGLVLSVE